MRMGIASGESAILEGDQSSQRWEEMVLTERGKAIAVIKPLQTRQGEERTVRRLEAAGVLRAASKNRPLPGWSPRPLKGLPISAILREERDAT